jgi:hypothetical protein
MFAVLFAVLAAACNAFASVMQRHEAASRPASESFRLALILGLVRRPLWWVGIGGVIGGAACQAVALMWGELAVVQPILMVELPMTLLLAAAVWRRRPTARPMIGLLAISAGVALLLVAVDPSGGVLIVAPANWLLVLPPTVGAVLLLVAIGRRLRGAPAAALLGSSAAVSFALAAALMKDATGLLQRGVAAIFESWQLYATCVAGLAALFLLQNAYQAGPLIAAQPAITVGDALVSLVYSVALFEERLRLGWWLAPELFGLALIVLGSLELSRSPLIATTVGGGARAESPDEQAA